MQETPVTASQSMQQTMNHSSASPVAVYLPEDMSSLGPSNVVATTGAE